MRVRLSIWDKTNSSKLADLHTTVGGQTWNIDSLRPTGKKLGAAGSGGFTIQRDHPAASACKADNVVRVVDAESGDPLYAFAIDRVEDTDIAVRHPERTITVHGVDLTEQWDEAAVRPWLVGNDRRPVSQERVWNLFSPRGISTASWGSTLHVQTPNWTPVLPEAWPMAPDFNAPIYSRAFDAGGHPAGKCAFRLDLTSVSAMDLGIYLAADDNADLWFQGVLLNRHSVVWPDTSGWSKPWREVPPHSGGDLTIGVETTNVGGPAFMRACGFEIVDGLIGDAVFSTGTGWAWKWLDYPSTKPGFTAPQIMQMLLDEEQDAGGLTGWTIETHGSHPNIEEFSIRVGSTYREAIESLRISWADIEADAEGLVLHMWPKGGRIEMTAINIPRSAIEFRRTDSSGDYFNQVQLIWGDGVRTLTRTPKSGLRRKTKAQQLGQWTDAAVVDELGNAFLDAHEEPVPAISATLLDLPDMEAGKDYSTGSLIKVDDVDLVVTGLNWTMRPNGDVVTHPEFGSLVALRRLDWELTQRRLARQFESPVTAPLLASERLLLSGHPSTGTFTWGWPDDIEDALNEDDPDKPKQIQRASRTQRAWKWAAEIDFDDLPDAWGTTVIELHRGGSLWNGLFNLTLSTTVWATEKLMWGYEVFTEDQAIQPRVVDVGGHVDGTITFHYADPV